MFQRTTKFLVVISIIAGIVGYAKYTNSATNYPANGYCGEPSSNTCANGSGCHGTIVVKNSNGVKFWMTRDMGTSPKTCTAYVPDSSYFFDVAITHPSSINGFQSVIVDHNGSGAGGFSLTLKLPNPQSVHISSGSSSKYYISQDGGTDYAGTGTSGENLSKWSVLWTAPHLPSGKLIVYTCGLKKSSLGRTFDSTFCRVDTINYSVSGTGIKQVGLDQNINTYASNNTLHINYNFDNAKQIAFEVYDMSGNRIYNIANTVSASSSQNINVSGWPRGAYIVRGIADGESWAKKIVLQ